MTKLDVALNAIRGTQVSRRAHIDIMETLRILGLTTDEAVELRAMVRDEWHATEDKDSDAGEILSLAKTVVNQYARNPSFR